jgi:hypothetical protein
MVILGLNEVCNHRENLKLQIFQYLIFVIFRVKFRPKNQSKLSNYFFDPTNKSNIRSILAKTSNNITYQILYPFILNRISF